MKDLQRFMRRDNPRTRDVFMTLGHWNIVRSDLMPLIATHHQEKALLLNAGKRNSLAVTVSAMCAVQEHSGRDTASW